MMPKRLAEPGSDATDFERRVLAARVDPKPGERERRLVWERLIVGVAAPPDRAGASPPQEAPPSPVLPTTPWTALLLSGGLGMLIGVAATIGYFSLQSPESASGRDAPNPVDTTAAVATAPEAAKLVPAASGQLPPSTPVESLQVLEARGAPERAVPVGSGVSVRESPEPASVASRLREEATLLRQAREQLGRGAVGQAAASLAESRARFPDSRLLPERDALTVELLLRQGRNNEAASLARAFLSKYPHSPHAVQVTRALETREATSAPKE